MKKKMYYNMRIKTLKRNTSNVIRKGMEARYISPISPLYLPYIQRHPQGHGGAPA